MKAKGRNRRLNIHREAGVLLETGTRWALIFCFGVGQMRFLTMLETRLKLALRTSAELKKGEERPWDKHIFGTVHSAAIIDIREKKWFSRNLCTNILMCVPICRGS